MTVSGERPQVRLRVSACAGIAGTWSVCFFLGLLVVAAARKQCPSYGFWVSFAAAALLATGATFETVFLWRHERAEGGNP